MNAISMTLAQEAERALMGENPLPGGGGGGRVYEPLSISAGVYPWASNGYVETSTVLSNSGYNLFVSGQHGWTNVYDGDLANLVADDFFNMNIHLGVNVQRVLVDDGLFGYISGQNAKSVGVTDSAFITTSFKNVGNYGAYESDQVNAYFQTVNSAEFEEINGGRIQAQVLRDEVEVRESTDVDTWITNASGGKIVYDEVDGGSIYAGGNGVDTFIFDSEVDSVVMPGEHNSLDAVYSNIGRAYLGDNAIVYNYRSDIDSLDMGEDGYLSVSRGFVNGEIGEGTDVRLYEAHAILELNGNHVTQDGGQSIFDAANGEVDTFQFTGGALVDGSFDPFDVVQMTSGADWTFEELTSRDQVVELPDDVVVAAYVDDAIDYDFGGKG